MMTTPSLNPAQKAALDAERAVLKVRMMAAEATVLYVASLLILAVTVLVAFNADDNRFLLLVQPGAIVSAALFISGTIRGVTSKRMR